MSSRRYSDANDAPIRVGISFTQMPAIVFMFRQLSLCAKGVMASRRQDLPEAHFVIFDLVLFFFSMVSFCKSFVLR